MRVAPITTKGQPINELYKYQFYPKCRGQSRHFQSSSAIASLSIQGIAVPRQRQDIKTAATSGSDR
ncbi:hypothetical protein H6F74_26625 [Trichocoleus sp. FACHB-90]|uniref:hypothetical protein n=1 Tax=Cyanophyceae TaxID=3028117 RepID=UPI00168752E5|nr:hypothetical protein [Trichocoleus sp. FACHB-90]MBD1929781.1 hypothetical protein [Trichocoleus sp. FACHB-90]